MLSSDATEDVTADRQRKMRSIIIDGLGRIHVKVVKGYDDGPGPAYDTKALSPEKSQERTWNKWRQSSKRAAQSKRAALKSKELTDSEDLSDLQFVHQDKDTAREAKKLTQERSHGRRSDDDGVGERTARRVLWGVTRTQPRLDMITSCGVIFALHYHRPMGVLV